MKEWVETIGVAQFIANSVGQSLHLARVPQKTSKRSVDVGLYRRTTINFDCHVLDTAEASVQLNTDRVHWRCGVLSSKVERGLCSECACWSASYTTTLEEAQLCLWIWETRQSQTLQTRRPTNSQLCSCQVGCMVTTKKNSTQLEKRMGFSTGHGRGMQIAVPTLNSLTNVY